MNSYNRQNATRLALVKVISLLSVVRWYNILLVTSAQYLASIYIINSPVRWFEVIGDPNLLLLAVSSAFLIAAGYIINAFYDAEKDMINKPNVAMFNEIVSKKFRLYCYFTFNAIGVFLALAVNKYVALFHFLFSVGLWLYSHKFKKMLFIGNLTGTLLSIAPFFSISIYYQEITRFIILYVGFIFLIELTREIVKDMMAMRGDLIMGYKTMPVELGMTSSKWALFLLQALTISIPFFLYAIKGISPIMLYFLFSAILVFGSMIALLISDEKGILSAVNTIYKIILVSGVISIVLF